MQPLCMQDVVIRLCTTSFGSLSGREIQPVRYSHGSKTRPEDLRKTLSATHFGVVAFIGAYHFMIRHLPTKWGQRQWRLVSVERV